MWEAVMHQSTE